MLARWGVVIQRDCAVVGIESVGGRITAVATTGGVVATHVVVCAAGAWSAEIGAMVGVTLPVTPLRRQVLVTEPVDGIPRALPMTIDFSSTLYFHAEGPGMLVGMADPDETPGFKMDPSEDWLVHVSEQVAHRVPWLLDAGVHTQWAGLYEVSPDNNALIGEARDIDRFLYATGFSGHGFLQGPAVGEVIRDLYLERPPIIDVTPLTVDRFAAGATRHENSLHMTAATSVPDVSRPNAIEVDLDAITHNVRAVRREVGADTKLFGAVKANGYGFGLPAVAQAIMDGGGYGFGLSDPEDALRIRRAGIDAPILLYGGMIPGAGSAAFARRWGLMVPVGERDAAEALRGTTTEPTDVVVEVDVGLERLGVGVRDAAELVKAVARMEGIRLAGITTHVHGVGGAAYLEWQLGRFKEVVDALAADGVSPQLRLAESSATLGTGAHPWCNAVDPGHLLYGLLPRGREDRPPWLRSALVRVTSRLLQVKTVDPREFAAESPVSDAQPARIGVIPMGSGDGLRALSCGEVLVHGRRCRVVGPLSLEHARVDLSDIPDAARDDEVVIVGSQGGSEITADEVVRANGLGSAGLGVVTPSSVKRVYVGRLPGPSGYFS